ncbi:MAG: hypothetical protein ACRETW_12690 [Stenotrophobium sp.]
MNAALNIQHQSFPPFPALFTNAPPVPGEIPELGWTHIATQDEALGALRRAADLDPRDYPVGIALGIPAIEQAEMFCWFASWASLRGALRHVLTPLASTRPDQVYRFRWWLARMRISDADGRPDSNQLRKVFAPALRINWMGTFAELRSANGEFARGKIGSYLQMDIPQDQPDMEVPACYLEGFIAYLRRSRRLNG